MIERDSSSPMMTRIPCRVAATAAVNPGWKYGLASALFDARSMSQRAMSVSLSSAISTRR